MWVFVRPKMLDWWLIAGHAEAVPSATSFTVAEPAYPATSEASPEVSAGVSYIEDTPNGNLGVEEGRSDLSKTQSTDAGFEEHANAAANVPEAKPPSPDAHTDLGSTESSGRL